MRTLSASALKGRTKNLGILPRQGSNLRKVYDLLHDNFGLPVKLSGAVPKFYDAITVLKDFYGCDIRNVSRGDWMLVGEWIGTEYRDYCLIRELLNEKPLDNGNPLSGDFDIEASSTKEG